MALQGAGRTRLALGAIFVLALLVRAAVGYMARGHGEMEGLADRYQEEAYALAAGYGAVRPLATRPPEVNLIRLADSLEARGAKLTPRTAPPIHRALWRPSTMHPPGYAVFLLGIYRLLGEPLIPKAKVVQVLLDAASILLVYSIGKRFAGRTVGLLAATAAALSAPAAFLATSRVADSLCPALYVLVFWLSVRALETRRALWFVAAGAACGIISLMRPDYLVYPPFLFLGALLFLRQPLAAIRGTAFFAAAMFLVLLPWGLRNQRVFGTFTVSSTCGWAGLYQTIGQFKNPYGIVFSDALMDALARDAGFDSFDDPAANSYFKGKFLAIVRENPAFLAGEALRRIPMAVAPMYRWGYVNAHYEAGHGFYDYLAREGLSTGQAVRRHPRELLLAYWDRLLSGAISLGLFVASVAFLVAERRRWRTAVLLLLPYATIVLTHLGYNMGARFLAPALFCQLVVAAYWIVRLSGSEPVTLWEPGRPPSVGPARA